MKKELNSFQDFDPNYLERVSMCFGTHIKTQEAERDARDRIDEEGIVNALARILAVNCMDD